MEDSVEVFNVSTNRFKILELKLKSLGDMIIEGIDYRYKVLKGLPLPSKILSARYNMPGESIYLLIFSESFEEIEDGKEIPLMDPIQIETTYTSPWMSLDKEELFTVKWSVA